MQTVRQLDEHHADVIDHGEHHLSQVFGLLLLARDEIDLADLGDAFDNVGHLLAEILANVDDGDRRVFNRVVEEAGGDGNRIHFHFGEDERDFEGMDEIRLTGGAGLALMVFQGEVIRVLHDGQIVVRTVFLHPLHQFAELGEREGGRLDLLAQTRHEGL